ncbi:class I SAM-dependent methyltransferase [Streptomyces sp. NPDC058171]
MTEPPFVAAVRESYDTVAADYAQHVKAPSERDPLSRAVLTAFAELVRTGAHGPVADVGCGPGKVTAHLAAPGVPAFGIDVSPRMVEPARETHPALRFTAGSMTALEIGDHRLGGLPAHYSVPHAPPASLPGVFAEFHRTLAPGAPGAPGARSPASWASRGDRSGPGPRFRSRACSYRGRRNGSSAAVTLSRGRAARNSTSRAASGSAA